MSQRRQFLQGALASGAPGLFTTNTHVASSKTNNIQWDETFDVITLNFLKPTLPQLNIMFRRQFYAAKLQRFSFLFTDNQRYSIDAAAGRQYAYLKTEKPRSSVPFERSFLF